MSRRERLKRKKEIRERAEREQREMKAHRDEAIEDARDDLEQAVVKRKGELHCPSLNQTLKFTALSIGEQGEVREAALRYYRRERLTAEIDDLKTMKESGLIEEKDFDRQLQTARDSIKKLSFSDLPKREVSIEKDGKTRSQKVEFERWFMAVTQEGQITAVHVSLQAHHPEITREDLRVIMSDDPDFFIDAADTIGDLTESLIAKKSRRRQQR